MGKTVNLEMWKEMNPKKTCSCKRSRKRLKYWNKEMNRNANIFLNVSLFLLCHSSALLCVGLQHKILLKHIKQWLWHYVEKIQSSQIHFQGIGPGIASKDLNILPLCLQVFEYLPSLAQMRKHRCRKASLAFSNRARQTAVALPQ